jgi:hypothetical protein
VCKLPSSKEKDAICYLISEASGPEGIDRLKQHVEQSPEWNSEELRNQLQAKYLEFDHEDKRNLCDCLSRKDISTCTKSDLLQLCRDWEFRSDIWNYIQKASFNTPSERLNRKLSLKIDWSEEKPLPSTSSPRCIDPSHTQPCVVCLPAPLEEEEYRYQLVGDPGRKNGEKKLRKFIQMTREWNSSEMRKRVANAFKNRPDLGTFGKVIQNKEAANLRKPHLIRLCREWNFKSNIWQVKKGGSKQHGKKPVVSIQQQQKAIEGARGHLHANVVNIQQQQQQQQQKDFSIRAPTVSTLMMDPGGPGPGPSSSSQPHSSQSQDPKLKLIGLISKMNLAFTDSGKKLLQLGSHFWSQDKVAQLFPKKAGTYLSGEETALIFRASHTLLQSSSEMLKHFAASTKSHTQSFGCDTINVISLISGTQLVALSKLKLEATKAELLAMRSQMTLAQSSGLAWFELSNLAVESIFTETEKTITQTIAVVGPVFPSHLEKLLSSILMLGLSLFTSCRCLMSFLRFCGYGVYLDSLIHTVTIFSEYEDQVLNTLHHLVALVLGQMVSTSSVSPALMGTIQALLHAGGTSQMPSHTEEEDEIKNKSHEDTMKN